MSGYGSCVRFHYLLVALILILNGLFGLGEGDLYLEFEECTQTLAVNEKEGDSRGSWQLYHQNWTEGEGGPEIRLLRPLLAVPEMRMAGQRLKVEVEYDGEAEVEDWIVYITPSVLSDPKAGTSYDMEVTGQGVVGTTHTLEAEIPQEVPPVLYDLTVGLDGAYWSNAHALMVQDEMDDNFTFIHITDPHISSVEGDYLESYRHGIRELNIANPEFVICSGDITDEARPAEYELFMKETLKLMVPIYVISGNHDYYTDHGGGIGYYLDMVNPYQDYTFDYADNLRFYCMDSGPDNAIAQCRGFTSDQINWLGNDLAANGQEYGNRMLMNHGPWYDGLSPNQMGGVDVVNVCGQHNVTWVFTGHTHFDKVHNRTGKRQGGNVTPPEKLEKPAFIQTTTFSKGKWYTYQNGYRNIEIKNGAVVNYTFDLNYDGKRDAESSRRVGYLNTEYLEGNDGQSNVARARIKNDLSEALDQCAVTFLMPRAPDKHMYFTEPFPEFKARAVVPHGDMTYVSLEGVVSAISSETISLRLDKGVDITGAEDWNSSLPSVAVEGVIRDLELKVCNKGVTYTGDFTVRVETEKKLLHEDVLNLSQDQEVAVEFPYYPDLGEGEIKVLLDMKDEVIELNEDNNLLVHHLEVVEDIPVAEIKTFQVLGDIRQNSQGSMLLTVKNTGYTNKRFDLTLEGEEEGVIASLNRSEVNVASGGYKQVELTVTVGSKARVGEHSLYTKVWFEEMELDRKMIDFCVWNALPELTRDKEFLTADKALPASIDVFRAQDDDDSFLSYMWDFGDGETAATENTITSHTYYEAGNYTCNLTVDDGDDTAWETVEVRVRDFLVGIDYREDTYYEGDTINLTASIAEGDPNASTDYEWSVKYNGIQECIGTGPNITLPELKVGRYRVALTGLDRGRADTTFVDLDVTERYWLRYRLEIVSPEEGERYETGKDINFSARAVDGNGIDLGFENISWLIDGKVVEGSTVYHNFSSKGKKTVEVWCAIGRINLTAGINVTVVKIGEESDSGGEGGGEDEDKEPGPMDVLGMDKGEEDFWWLYATAIAVLTIVVIGLLLFLRPFIRRRLLGKRKKRRLHEEHTVRRGAPHKIHALEPEIYHHQKSGENIIYKRPVNDRIESGKQAIYKQSPDTEIGKPYYEERNRSVPKDHPNRTEGRNRRFD